MPCKHEDQSSDPQQTCKKLDTATHVCRPSPGKAEEEGPPEAHWPVKPAELKAYRFNERTLCQKRRWRTIEEDT